MKYFTIGTLALAGLSHANLDANTTAVCVGDVANEFANNAIAAVGGNADDYVINSNNLQNGTPGKFMTIMCRSAPWQHNGNVYSPYADSAWDADKAADFVNFQQDHAARLTWINNNGGSVEYPAGSGGSAWCGYKGDGSAVQWNAINEVPLCPDHDEVASWNAHYEASLNVHPPQASWDERQTALDGCPQDAQGRCGCMDYNHRFKMGIFGENQLVWRNRGYTTVQVPDYLEGLEIIMGDHGIGSDIVMKYTPGARGTIYALSEITHGERNGNWPTTLTEADGWTYLEDRIFWGGHSYFQIWRKEVTAEEVENFTVGISGRQMIGALVLDLECGAQ